MTRPLWDKRTPLWLAAAVVAVGVFVVVVWRGERQLAQQEAENQQKQAALAKEAQDIKATADRASKQLVEQQRFNEQFKTQLAKAQDDVVGGQLTIVGLTYRSASEKLGRPPKGPDELMPYLKSADALTSPRDRKPFEIAWGISISAPGRLLVWESTPGEDGGRMVLTTEASAIPKRVTAEEFKVLSSKAD